MTGPMVAVLVAIACILGAIYIPPAHRGYSFDDETDLPQ